MLSGPSRDTVIRVRFDPHQVGCRDRGRPPDERPVAAAQGLREVKGLVFEGGTTVDATIVNATSSTQGVESRDPQMPQTRKGSQCCRHDGVRRVRRPALHEDAVRGRREDTDAHGTEEDALRERDAGIRSARR